MRHDLPPRSIPPVPFGVREATTTAPLIASPSLALGDTPCDLGAAASTVCLPTVTVAADECAPEAASAHKCPGGSLIVGAAILNQAWTADRIGVILPLHPCPAR